MKCELYRCLNEKTRMLGGIVCCTCCTHSWVSKQQRAMHWSGRLGSIWACERMFRPTSQNWSLSQISLSVCLSVSLSLSLSVCLQDRKTLECDIIGASGVGNVQLKPFAMETSSTCTIQFFFCHFLGL